MKSGADRIAAWLADEAAEGQRFDVKQSLDLAGSSNRKELLKDLTGMGNGGGGTVVFGIAERKLGSESVADTVVPLQDRQLVAVVVDVVADGVRPTLRWTYDIVEQPGGGYVLIVDVDPSPLGPYMVEAYKDHRYWRRVQADTRPMDERMVHDLYALAARWEGQRAAMWERLQLPLSRTWSAGPWLTASGVPEYVAGEPFDPSRHDPESLTYERADTPHARIAGLHEHPARLGVWADGFVAAGDAERVGTDFPRGPQSVLRIHRDGAVGLGVHLATPHQLDATRALNAQLDYVAQLWDAAGVSRVELRIELSGLTQLAANDRTGPFPTLGRGDATTPPAEVSLAELVLVADLRDAPVRHRLLARFADRVANCFGEARQRVGFDVGSLHSPAGPVEGTARVGTIGRWADRSPNGALVGETGAVRMPHDHELIGWWDRGVLADLDGNVVAALEFAQSDALPADFMPAAVDRSDVGSGGDWDPEPWGGDLTRPPWTRRWSDWTFDDFLMTFHR